VSVFEGGDHVYNGIDETIDGITTPQVPIGPSESWVFELLSTVVGVVHLSGVCWVDEMGG
jgi:hypothetical protein